MPRQDAGAANGVERFFQFSLLGLVASGYLAVAGSGYLDTPTLALTAAGLLLRGILICGWLRLDLSDRLTTLVTAGYSAFFFLDYYFLSRDFLGATVHLLFFLAVMKILTARSNRDYLYTAVIAFLELLAAAILSISLNFFLFLALFLIFAVGALTSGEIRRSLHRSTATARAGNRNLYPRLGALSALITVGILSLTACLFFILPRTAEAAFAHLIAHRVFLPGFSNQVNLGDIGEIKTSSRPMMHVRMWSAQPVAPLKWRGGALGDFNGKRWTNPSRQQETIAVDHGHASLAAADSRPPGRRRLGYQVSLEALENDTLFFAGSPEDLDLNVRTLYRSENNTYHLGRSVPQGFRYEAWSLLEESPERGTPLYPPPVLSLSDREKFLQLPPLDSRIAALARTFAGDATTELSRARAIERHLRSDFAYTLELPKQESADPLANFLFVRRKGHCEYFASAMAVMLRTLGIPSRMATGFQSGVYNPVSELWLMRASDAHSWVEAWIPGRGWTTFDPTPADPNGASFGLFSRAALYLDAAETFWQDWVVAYDLARQGTLAYRMEQSARSTGIRWFASAASWRSAWDQHGKAWIRRFGWLAMAFIAVLLAVAFAARPLYRLLRVRRRVELVRRGQASVGDATVLYLRMLEILKRRGYQKPVWFTPTEFAASIPPGPLGDSVGEFTATYNALRFGGHAATASRLSLLLDRMECS